MTPKSYLTIIFSIVAFLLMLIACTAYWFKKTNDRIIRPRKRSHNRVIDKTFSYEKV